MKSLQLSEHFNLSEFERSATADKLHIDNTIPEELIPNLKNLCEQVLEPLREHFDTPVIISSGYRCPQLNKAVGGVPNSQHQKGEAADIHIPSTKEGHDWFLWIMENTCFDQLIWEKNGSSRWIHISCKLDLSKNRQSVFKTKK